MIDHLLEKLYNSDNSDSAIDLIFDHMDSLLYDGNFIECDEILQKIDVNKISTCLMRLILVITIAAKDNLPSRAKLYHKIKSKMLLLKGAETTQKLISRLN